MAEAPLYDLLLLLSSDAPEEQRARVLSLVESSISQAGGQIERDDNWGRRPMSFQIRHQSEAEYHLLQFRAPGSIIEELSHTLRITDGVLRVRIIKVRRGTPAAKTTPPPVVAAVAAAAPSSPSPAAAAAPAEEDDATPNDARESSEEPAELVVDRETEEALSEAPGAPE